MKKHWSNAILRALVAHHSNVADRLHGYDLNPHEDDMLLMSDAVDDRRVMADAIIAGRGPEVMP